MVSKKIRGNQAKARSRFVATRFVYVGLLAGTIALGANLSQWLSCNAAPAVKAKGATAQGIPPEISRLWQAPSPQFAAAVANLASDPKDISIANLRRFLESQNFTSNNTERLVASYSLARLLAKSNNSADQNEAIALFTQAQGLPLLHIDSLWHAAEVLTSQGDNRKTRDFVEKILRDPAADTGDQARALYEMAQSFLREPSGENNQKAKDLLLTLKQKYGGTEFGTASNYYLGQLALSNSNNNSSATGNNALSSSSSSASSNSSAANDGAFGSSTGNSAGISSSGPSGATP